MKLLGLKGENFRSFADFELDFNANGLYSVTGPNGAGKSSIFAAVEWALFGGKRGPGTPPVRRNDCDGACRVELEFEVDGRVFRVVRVDGSDARLTDVGSGAELACGLTDTSHEVAVQLGLTQNMFAGTFYARQKEVQALSSSKSLNDRRDQLERLLGIEHLRVAADLATRDARERKAMVDRLAEETPDIDELREEVKRCEREAQEAAPAIAKLEAKVNELREAEQRAVAQINALTKQIAEHAARRLAFSQADAELRLEQTALENLRQQLTLASSAHTELAELAPLAARAGEVTALEREMDQRRRNHELIENLRTKERDALEELAKATDALATLPEVTSDEEAPAERLLAAQQQLNDSGERRRVAAAARQAADDVARLARERLARANSRAEAERELATLTQSEAEVARSRDRWQELRDARADVQAQLNHDAKHRDALNGVGDTDTAVCPTCGHTLDGTLGDLLAEYDASIAQRESQIKGLSDEMDQIAAIGKQHKAAAERAQQLRAQLAGLEDADDRQVLSAESDTASAAAITATEEERRLDAEYKALAEHIPTLKVASEQAAQLTRRRSEALERKQRAEQAASSYAEQRDSVGSNGYDLDAHMQLKADLEATEHAVRRCAALRVNADAVELLESRFAQQDPIIEQLQHKVKQLREHAAEIEPAEDAHETAEARQQRVADEHEVARRELEDAKQQVSAESTAVNTARTRLEDGRQMLRRVEQERQEYIVQATVAKALADYREHASQKARPTLEREASHLLKQVTGGNYPIIRLTDAYLLEIADGGRFHALKRFSGGEQDLAALCLRLALSRTLARQRGAEHGFVILDEVFGSQDADRRRLLMQQLGELAEAEFQQIFVISHTDDISEHCQLHVRVSRDGQGVSVAEGPSPT